MLLATLLVLSGVLNSCKAGPKVRGCVVDAKKEEFACVTYPDVRSVIPFEEGQNLECMSATDLEQALKACKEHRVKDVTLCSVRLERQDFWCLPPEGNAFFLDYKQVDNYFCLSPKDRRRVLERCKPVQ
jgi:hypothetical protein